MTRRTITINSTTVVIPEQEEAIQERVWKGRLKKQTLMYLQT
jgi:hypothetical protein